MIQDSPLDRLADAHHEAQCRLDPVRATLSGTTGFDDALPDYSPDGWAERLSLCEATLAGLDALPAVQDAPAAAILRERLEAEAAYLGSGLAASLNVVVSPPMLIRECLGQADTAGEAGARNLEARLRAVPAALDGYLSMIVEEAGRGRPPAREQAEVVALIARSWSTDAMFTDLAADAAARGAAGSPALGRALAAAAEAATAAYADFADGLERRALPRAVDDDTAGPQAYGMAARYFLGVDIDVQETYAWLAERLHEVEAQTLALAGEFGPGANPREVAAHLDADPAWQIGADRLEGWLRERLDLASDLVGRHVIDVPVELKAVEAVVSGEGGPIRYLPPTADLSRPGRVIWPSSGEPAVPVWSQVTVVHHEGVPGHHLQMGAAVLDPALPVWRRHTHVPGHAEGWAVYAEGLMFELGALDGPPALGYLMGLRANLAVALADVGAHTRLPMISGEPWTRDRTAAFLRAHSTIAEPMLDFTVLRGRAWPGQALTYAYGARVWHDAREAARRRLGAGFDSRAFHSQMLGLGPCGLSVIAAA
ncbi:DUF885 domain-containing protein [Planomonospora sp. ID67723]|uniref:DUF885 domain-containing protein n=1 Tax=Planomonospora sp. ID67723 TaxID=2738134 RepID=UPI0018C3BF7E|nr:DUF885 domain-containing protein [Planomonospora sp. ID67723]MBG0831310.1 DUF885 domain-containing protein [Planomonospora sp. ID67723]